MTEFLAIIKALGWPGAFLFTIYFCVKYPDKIQIWISLVQRYFGNRSLKYERKSISNEIEGRINLFAKKINSEVGNIFPYGIKMEWVEDSSKGFDREAFRKKDQVIIKMKHHTNQDRNLSVAILEYVSKGLIPKGRLYVSKNIMKSIDFKMVHKILLSNRSYSAVEYFSDHILYPEVEEIPEIKNFLEKMHTLDDHGFFASILLFELMILGKKIPQGIENVRKRVIAEVKDFISFLDNIATSKPGEEAELHFIRKEIRVSLLLVARSEYFGYTKNYLWRFGRNLEEGCERVYIASTGTNIKFAKTVSSEIENKYEVEKSLEKTLNVMNRKGDFTKGYICLFQPKNENRER